MNKKAIFIPKQLRLLWITKIYSEFLLLIINYRIQVKKIIKLPKTRLKHSSLIQEMILSSQLNKAFALFLLSINKKNLKSAKMAENCPTCVFPHFQQFENN